MPAVHRVAILGLRDFEREAIAACLRLSRGRTPGYELAALLDAATLLVADAEHAPSVQVVLAAEMLGCTLFIGAAAPAGAAARMPRPIDPQQLLRELDALVAEPFSAPAAHAVDRRRATPPAPETPAPTALLVDDSEIALRFLESRLQRFSLVMDRALGSGRAIELMSKRRYDFVFLDVELGTQSDLDGLALCQHIKRQQDQLVLPSAVFIVSAHATQMDRVRGGLAGCDGYLGKPLDEVELQRLLLRHGLKPRAPGAPDGALPASVGAAKQPPAA